MNSSMITLMETAAGGNTAAQLLSTILPLVLLAVVFYFLILRPQKKQDKEIAEMRNSLEVGDEIITIGGIVGTVIIIKDDKLMIETGNDKTKLTMLRSSVKTILKDEEPAAK